MGKYIAEQTVKKLIEADRPVKNAKVLILGWTFKEDVPDVRNTRVNDIYNELLSYGVNVMAHDPHADMEEVKHEYGIELLTDVKSRAPYDAVILAVKHRELGIHRTADGLKRLGNGSAPVVVDVKGLLPPDVGGQLGRAPWEL